MANPVSYHPPSEEQAYYEHLFQTADVSKTGQINGRDAVTFLSKSKLPLDLLKNIWTIADQNPKTNQLDRTKFTIAVRLIQLAQNGITLPSDGSVGGDLGLVNSPTGGVMQAPFFEGVTDGVPAAGGSTAAGQQQAVENPQANVGLSTPARRESTGAVSQHQQQSQPTPQRPDYQTAPSMRSVAPTPQQQVQQTPHQAPPPPQQPTPSTQPSQNQLTHDPYNMTPSEKSRYEQLFPQYARGDGYVYGKEAVELFTKSGMDKNLLRNIWNMVDTPVDNRLSKLEFAIAMHLIVCVSKKNLPMPTLIPPSLKGLKDAEVMNVNETVPNVGGIGVSGGTAMGGSNNVVGGIPSPNPVSPPQQTESITTTGSSSPVQTQSQPQPQPQPQPQFSTGLNFGGMSIHDAFENLSSTNNNNDPSSTAGSDITPTTTHTSVSVAPTQPATVPVAQIVQPQVTGQLVQSQVTANVHAPPAITSAPTILSTSSVGETSTSVVSTEELKNLQSILQKMQAENVSLKAQLGQCSEEESTVRKEITQTVAEISTLSMELTSLRAQVADAKSSLIEATSELKAQIEKRDILRSLLEDAASTKKAIELGALQIKELEAVAKEAKFKSKAIDEESKSRDPPTPYDQGFFNYDNADSGLANNYMLHSQFAVDAPPSSPTSSYNPTGNDTRQYQSNQPAPARDSIPHQQMPPMPSNDPPVNPGAYFPQQQQQTQQQQRQQPDPPVEEMQKLGELKQQADEADKNAASAIDQARAYAIQYEDLRAQAERAEIILNEKKPKKKGFLRGGKREAKKEMEQARQMAQMKTNEAQHAHLAMKRAEDEAEQLKQQAQIQRKKVEDFELVMAKKASEQAEAQRVAEIQRTESNPPTLDSDLSYSNSYAPPMSFGGFVGASSPAHASQRNDPDIMGGSVGYGDGVMGGYASSSVGFTDNSVYSVTGSLTYGTGALPGGYTSDAASHSVTSEPLLYPALETPNNGGGSVTGLSTSGSITHTGSVTNVPAVYTSDATTHSVAGALSGSSSINHTGSVTNAPVAYTSDTSQSVPTPEMLLPASTDNNSLPNTENNDKPPLAAGSEMKITPQIDMPDSNVDLGIGKTATSASNDTETMNNTSAINQNNGISSDPSEQTVTTDNITDTNHNETIRTMGSNVSSIQPTSSNDFGSFQSPDFDGIPSPDKGSDDFVSIPNPAFISSMNTNAQNLMINSSEGKNERSDPDLALTEVKVDLTCTQAIENTEESRNFNLVSSHDEESPAEDTDNNDFIQVQTNEGFTDGEIAVVADIAPTEIKVAGVSNSRSGEITLETVTLSGNDSIAERAGLEENGTPSNENMKNVVDDTLDPPTLDPPIQNDGLIPSPKKEVIHKMTMGTTASDGLIPSPQLKELKQMTLGAAMSLSIDSKYPSNSFSHDANVAIMTNQSKGDVDFASFAPQNVMSVAPPPSLGPSLSTDGSLGGHLGIMSQSSDGGIPTPTNSKDEYDKTSW